MDPVTLVVTALAAGASSGVSGAATAAVGDAYAALKELLKRRFTGRGQDPRMLEAAGTEPAVWQARLADELTPADLDDEVRTTAQRLLAAADPAGYQAGRYLLDLRGAQGVQIGDGNTQTNTFG
jgi:hypothetical protein